MIIKKKESKEDNLVLLNIKCDNCGASLKYNKENLSCKCNYCRTEYYVTQDGVLEGQLIRLKIHGEEKKFYIGREEYHKIFSDACRDMSGRLIANQIATKMKLTLIEI